MSAPQHAMLVAAALLATAIGGCAKVEDADTKILRNDVDNPPAATKIVTAQTRDMPASDDSAIANVLRKDAAPDGGLSKDARWIVAKTDLDRDGSPEALAYVLDPALCGSGGCTLYVLDQQDQGWVIADKIGPAQLPVYKLDSGPDGWSVLGVTIGGGGAQPAVMTVSHDPKGYIDNPTVAPAKPVTVSGVDPLLPDQEGTPLPAE